MGMALQRIPFQLPSKAATLNMNIWINPIWMQPFTVITWMQGCYNDYIQRLHAALASSGGSSRGSCFRCRTCRTPQRCDDSHIPNQTTCDDLMDRKTYNGIPLDHDFFALIDDETPWNSPISSISKGKYEAKLQCEGFRAPVRWRSHT